MNKSTGRRNLFVTLSAFAAVAMLGTSALAKTLCLDDNFGEHFIFSKVKIPKPGTATPLNGVFINSGFVAPFDGSATMNSAGTTLKLGIFVHSQNGGVNNYTSEWNGDPVTLAGSGVSDVDGSFTSDSAVTYTAVDCSTIVIP